MKQMTSPNVRTRNILASAVAAVGVVGLYAPAAVLAQDAGKEESGLEEVVVTARRTEENLQDIPISVQAISGDELDRHQMKSGADIAKLAPGLSLYLPEPSAPVVVLRGVRWTPGSGTPSVPFYLNEVPFDPAPMMQSMYDMGQVEVLRGPQGTARGAPSISGAITFTSRRPDLDVLTGYVSGLIGENSHRNLEGAISVPIIEGMLAVRAAVQYDDSEANRIKSVNDPNDPEQNTESQRLSVRFQPTDTLSLDAMYQQLDASGDVYTQVVGSGFAGSATLLPNYNGPALDLDDYRAVQDGADNRPYKYEHITFNAAWDVLGHTLSYNFGSQENVGGFNGYSSDVGNLYIGWNPLNQNRPLKSDFFNHELRLSSERDGDNFVDYDVGYFYQDVDSALDYQSPTGPLFPGAYGNPFAGAPRQSNYIADPAAAEHYGLLSKYIIGLATESKSYYGHLTFHLSDATELSGGVRYIEDDRPTSIVVTIPPINVAAAPALPGGGCPGALVPSPIYAGVCDSQLDFSSRAPPPQDISKKYEETIWNTSLSHHFTDSVLAYATVGTSWRQGLPAIGNAGLDSSLVIPNPEEATSYELGIKTEWDSNLRVNLAVFQIDYKDQLNQFRFTPFYNTITGATSATNTSFFWNVDAQVRGAEAEFLMAPMENLDLGLNLSYAQIESEGGTVPCNDPSRRLSAANPMNFCSSEAGEELNAAPKFQANLTANYVVPFESKPYEGYIRLLANYQDENPNFGASIEEADAYAIVDLFVGVQSNEGVWDAGFYGKNIFDELNMLTTNSVTTGISGADAAYGPSGYNLVTATVPREVGVSFRYNFTAD